MKIPYKIEEFLQPTPLLAMGTALLTLLMLGVMITQGPKVSPYEAPTESIVVAKPQTFVQEAEARREQILQKAEERLDEAKAQGQAPWVALPPLPTEETALPVKADKPAKKSKP
jgi:hypothetical protein